MFGSHNKPVVLSYGSRRSGPRVPRWLLLLLLGMAAGAGALWLVQERYLPPRLSVAESRELRVALDGADAERKSLRSQLAATTQQLQGAQAVTQRQSQELAAPRAEAQTLRDELSALIAALPDDPRGGAVQIRAARFTAKGGALSYDIVLTRDGQDAAKPLAGVLQFSVIGSTARGASTKAELAPVNLSIAGAHALERGSVPLPAGVQPQRVTVQVLDAPGGKTLGMRVLLVR